VLAAFGIANAPAPKLETWQAISDAIANPEGEVTIAIVGKYTGLKDAYKSLNEALFHGGIANKVEGQARVDRGRDLRGRGPAPYLENVDGILVPGGFGERGSEGKILAARFARTRRVPYFGICFGMQMAVIEAARDLGRHQEGRLHRVRAERGARRRPDDRVDARQRAGEAPPRRRAWRHHAPRRLSGRARQGQPRRQDLRRRARLRAPPPPLRGQHPYRARLEEAGLLFCGMSPDGLLPEIVELPDHPWFIGVQFHPS
jgi:CTP synthase